MIKESQLWAKKRMDPVTVNAILNEKRGDVLKTFTDETFVRHINNGEKAQYYVTEHQQKITALRIL